MAVVPPLSLLEKSGGVDPKRAISVVTPYLVAIASTFRPLATSRRRSDRGSDSVPPHTVACSSSSGWQVRNRTPSMIWISASSCFRCRRSRPRVSRNVAARPPGHAARGPPGRRERPGGPRPCVRAAERTTDRPGRRLEGVESAAAAERAGAGGVKQAFGHPQSGLTLGTYSHVVPELAKEAVDRMTAALWDPPAPHGNHDGTVDRGRIGRERKPGWGGWGSNPQPRDYEDSGSERCACFTRAAGHSRMQC
jgi:hypothetical protein